MRGLLRHVGRLPDRWVFPVAVRAAGRPARTPLTGKNRELLADFSRSVISGEPRLVVYERGQGPVVLFLHGWAGRGAHLALLANAVAAAGFRSVLVDAMGHGESGGNAIDFGCFAASGARVASSVGQPVHCVVGHSAGGLSVMAKRGGSGLEAKAYVCIAAPLYPYVPLNRLKAELGVSESVLARCKPYFARQLDLDWDELEQGAAYLPTSGAQLLLVYDTDDGQVRAEDGAQILEQWPGAELLTTTGLGHQRLLWDQRVIDRVVQFVDSTRTG